MRYFTIEEANIALEKIKPLMERLLEKRAYTATRGQELGEMLSDLRSDVGGRTASEIVKDFAEIEALVDEIQSLGCIVKNLEGGLVDFLYDLDGRDVYLCWRFGEPKILYYHDVHSGYQGRQPLP